MDALQLVRAVPVDIALQEWGEKVGEKTKSEEIVCENDSGWRD
jgi:hypothetical protein